MNEQLDRIEATITKIGEALSKHARDSSEHFRQIHLSIRRLYDLHAQPFPPFQVPNGDHAPVESYE